MSFALGFAAAFLVVALAVFLRARRRRHAPGSWLFRGLFSRLATSPAQERVFLDESAKLREELLHLRADWLATREELSVLLEAAALEPSRIEAVLAARDERLAALRRRAAEGLARFHAALDDAQRKLLAATVRQGRLGGARRRCGWSGRPQAA